MNVFGGILVALAVAFVARALGKLWDAWDDRREPPPARSKPSTWI